VYSSKKGPSKECLLLGGVCHDCEKYFISLFHVSGPLKQFGGVLFFGGKLHYFGGTG
jgi:hypothetical protein